MDPRLPFNDLPPLPPPVELETRDLLKACIAAHTALASLRQATGHLPNPAVLINTIPILEAQASSEIENIVTTTDELFRFAEHADAASHATKETLRYRTALWEGFRSAVVRGTRSARICSRFVFRYLGARECVT
ncbi:hypothetical protein KB893_018060 [Coralloluteibacterium stylophorae]|uniref:Fic/DOC N-terminal domain-containing protein n=1 Tax=Coralloluteibacterium stylophorae TaxID=1776034 RepID=A0A8J7VW02_9GAMM|nr:hypothetical protein [Coralloluteibacterium stylophorae]